MEPLVKLLRPLVEPLLKLSFAPPHLPEGTTLVRHLRPSAAWLSYRYLVAMFGLLGQVVGAGVVAVTLAMQLERVGLALAVLVGLAQLAVLGFTFVTTRVDYELRHYLVGDRSLRATMGVLARMEVTLSYANVQNVEVTQGPLERVFGFKSLTISTAGGDTTPGTPDNLHVVTLMGLDDAEGVKQLVMGMLKQHKDSGLGDTAPREVHEGLDLARLAEVRDAARRLEAAATGRRQAPTTGV